MQRSLRNSFGKGKQIGASSSSNYGDRARSGPDNGDCSCGSLRVESMMTLALSGVDLMKRFFPSGFSDLRVVLGFVLASAGALLALIAFGLYSGASALARNPNLNQERHRIPRDVANLAIENKIAPWVMERTANGQQDEFIVVLADQANLSRAAALPTKSEKSRYVYDALRNKSQATQGPILQWLRERGIEHRSFYIVNGLWVKGSREIAEALAARPDVARVEGNPHIQNSLPRPGSAVEGPLHPGAPATIEPGIVYTHAPDVWAQGFTGQGIVVAGADTGIRWTHNALKPHYRGWDGTTANHDFNWHDSIHDGVGNPCGNDSPQPCDDFSTVPTPLPPWSAAMAAPIRSEWRRGPSGSVAVIWTRATAPPPPTWSAWNSSSRRTRSTARRRKATQPKLPTLPRIPGPARLRKAVRMTLCNLPSKRKPQLAS